ncbi:O-acetyl-ADP-ribose deacetylase (regulator of RNase III), contains Macro domain [Nonomuraea pusilla]|uniref:O-acetyl-ADP-ribose deacetylase (Regulator of RNase III), contains Macro domain n=1 Tax=Nonomuraea pusilla TaxID=46177 RepID=A0A1H7Q8C5_9ACTN|nr:O-acetyl-ADP-ribose deacetylase (regulator of RNase III), contains Macro domain [Nonomuraea pusilla]
MSGLRRTVHTVISYVTGDATRPHGQGPKVICHVCNDAGGWGKGFVQALSRRWPQPEARYRAWHRSGQGFQLGAVRLVQVEPELWVANMIGQHGTRPTEEGPPIRYDALDRCLSALGDEALNLHASVHMPRIGTGLAGGSWERVEPLVLKRVSERGIPVTVYDLP